MLFMRREGKWWKKISKCVCFSSSVSMCVFLCLSNVCLVVHMCISSDLMIADRNECIKDLRGGGAEKKKMSFLEILFQHQKHFFFKCQLINRYQKNYTRSKIGYSNIAYCLLTSRSDG